MINSLEQGFSTLHRLGGHIHPLLSPCRQQGYEDKQYHCALLKNTTEPGQLLQTGLHISNFNKIGH